MPRHLRSTTLFVLVAFVMITFFTPPSSADIPQVINYQGKVADTGGVPVADGWYTMRFRVYDAVSGGTLLWDSYDRSVQVSGGVFDVLLGESPQPAITLPFDEDYWLLVTVEGDAQTPRQRLGSVGYAYMSSGLIPGTEVIGSVTEGIEAAIAGTNTATTEFSSGVYGESASTDGAGVYGKTTATTGGTYGVCGESVSTGGRGVVGFATAATGPCYGVFGQSASTSGQGVSGSATATAGVTCGVWGQSNSTDGRGVRGHACATTGTTYGVYGESESTVGRGVFGNASATTGATFGVGGQSSSPDGRGVYGSATATSGTNYGVYGKTSSPTGYAGYFQGDARVTGALTVDGTLDTGVPFELSGGVSGAAVISGTNTSSNGRGVYGYTSAATGGTIGVYGRSTSVSGYGVYGSASATTGSNFGVQGTSSSTSGRGVYGFASATSGTTYGVYGSVNSGSGYGGYFSGRFCAQGSINLTATPGNHVAQIYNTSSGTSPDVLLLKVGYSGNPSGDINFVTFFRGGDVAVGAVEGDGAGGVTYKSGSADFAEFLPKLNPDEVTAPGDVIGVYDGRVSKRTIGATQHLVVSTRPIVLGNDPGEDQADSYARVAFIGQVDVNVRGEVHAGDFLIPSGLEDGTAVAVSRDSITADQFAQVVGQAWEQSGDPSVKRIRASVGLQSHDPTVTRMAERIRQLEARLADLEASQGR